MAQVAEAEADRLVRPRALLLLHFPNRPLPTLRPDRWDIILALGPDLNLVERKNPIGASHDMDPIAADNLVAYLSTWIERAPN